MNKITLLFLCITTWLYGQTDYLAPDVRMDKPSAGYPLATLTIRNGLPRFFAKLNQADASPITIAYLGGSITNHNGYRVYSETWFKDQYPQKDIRTINAGVGGTGSDLGVFRLQDDVLAYRPDLVFVEFAVNDGNGDSSKISNAMEGIVRQIRRKSPKTDICFLYTINAPMLKEMEQGRLFKSMRLMEHIAQYYHLPSINFGVEVVKLMKADRLVFKGEKDQTYADKILFTDDNTHPTLDQGHRLYSEILSRSMVELSSAKIRKSASVPTAPLYPENFEYASMYAPKEFVVTSGWRSFEATHPLYQMNKNRCPDLLYTDNPNDSIVVRFKGRMIGVYDIIGPSSCGYVAVVDGHEMRVQRFDTYCYYSRNNYSLLPALDEGFHEVCFKLNSQPIEKERIVSARFADKITEKVRHEYQQNIFYVGKIMIIGELVK